MRTQTINIYRFSELSDKAKQKAIEWYRSGLDTQYIYDEAHQSVKALLELVPNLCFGFKSWLTPKFGGISDTILNLSGIRLHTWLMNNIYDSICKPAFRKSIDGAHPHRLTKVNRYSNGNVTTHIYSSFKKDFSCPLTGVCWDMDLLQPIIDHIKAPHPSVTFEDLINMCFSSLKKSLQDAEDYLHTDENCIEEIEANDYEFTENGERY